MEEKKSQKPVTKHLEMIELDVEELEPKIAPGLKMNHNETMLLDETGEAGRDSVELDVEELEPKIAPGIKMNHNETLLPDVM